MKITLKVASFLFLAAIFMYGCNKDNSISEIPEKVIEKPEEPAKAIRDTFLFLRKDVIIFKAYKGSLKGGVDITAQEKPETFWNSSKLSSYLYDTLTVTKDSTFERPYKYEINNFRFEQRKDSIFRWNRYAKFWEFYGLHKKDTVEQYVRFYSFQKYTPPYLFAENGHNSGEISYSYYFNDNKYLFKGPEDMKNENDEVAWYGIKYIYVKKK
ncbi:hypothetical protein HX021_16380 [Sphingobacterium sp. N143]|uniref:hypothetical protein n=1 Tax=Sphingobacterium sp. N143 TaxID=2746727 RepID=UPI0025769E48|nr:hypothetical protein [Sphingobacterium sp. N143]MDM1295868.1 hypothetical protein [Sphingobacterium sp. N143]